MENTALLWVLGLFTVGIFIWVFALAILYIGAKAWSDMFQDIYAENETSDCLAAGLPEQSSGMLQIQMGPLFKPLNRYPKLRACVRILIWGPPPYLSMTQAGSAALSRLRIVASLAALMAPLLALIPSYWMPEALSLFSFIVAVMLINVLLLRPWIWEIAKSDTPK